MAEKRKRGRPPKYLGLTPPLTKAVDRDALQNLREETVGQAEPVLPDARQSPSETTGPIGVFTAPDDPNGVGGASPEQPKVPGGPVPAEELKVGTLLRRILHEVAAPAFQEDGQPAMTNLEILLRKVVSNALLGNQFSVERVLDQFEGKPVRGAAVRTADTSLEDFIDQQSIALLNGLTPKGTT